MHAQHLFHHRRTAQRAPRACLQNKYGTQPHTIQDTRQTSPSQQCGKISPQHTTTRPGANIIGRQTGHNQRKKREKICKPQKNHYLCNALSSPDGGIGRRAGLKHQWIYFHAGSTPALGTM